MRMWNIRSALYKAKWLGICRRFTSTHPSTSRQPSYVHHIGEHPLVYRNVGQTLDLAASQFPNTEAIVSCHEQKRLTFSEVRDHVDRLSAGFVRLGLQQGDAVGIWASNNQHWYLTMLAAARAGLTSVGINPAYQGPEVEYCLQKVGVKALVASEKYKKQNSYELLERIIPELRGASPGRIRSEKFPHLKSVIIDSEFGEKGVFRLDDIFGMGTPEAIRDIHKMQTRISPDSPCNIQFTSGTTGKPKAAVLSHYNFVNNGIHIGKRNGLKQDRICVQVPLFHAFGVCISIITALNYGATLVLPTAGYNPEASLRAIVNESCTVIHGTPTMYVDLIKKQKELQLPLTSPRLAVTGGAPCSPQLFKDMKEVFSLKQVKTVYGMTELSSVCFQSRDGDTDEQIFNTLGHLQEHLEAKIIDADGNTVPFGQPGELCIRGYSSMLGYFRDEEKTKEMISADKWVRTGDQLILEENGYAKVVGRLKDMIIRGGENIFPVEIEDFFNAHPAVLEAHVIGVPDERLGEEICAFIRLKDKSNEKTVEELKAHCKGKIAHFKVPKYFVFVDSFPKTTSGKVQKFKLKEDFDRSAQKSRKVDVIS